MQKVSGRMYYEYTLLKDLPGCKAGKTYTFNEVPDEAPKEVKDRYGESCFLNHTRRLKGDDCEITVDEKTLNDPEWFKKEIGYDRCNDVKCPICGETRGVMYVTKKRKYIWDWDTRGDVVKVYYEYACGHGIWQLQKSKFNI